MAARGLPPQAKRKMRDVVPLDTPYTVLISPTDYCNINCGFCSYHGPASKLAAKSVMPLDFYKKIIDQLSEFPSRACRLTFSGFGEPTMHRDLPEMIAYAKEKDVAEQIMLVTNGLLLNPEYNLRLIHAGLDYIRISVPAIDDKTAYEITGHKIDVTEGYIENIRHLFQNKQNMIVLCKTTNFALGGKGGADMDRALEEKFYSMYDKICDYSFVEYIAPWAGVDGEMIAKQGLSAVPDKDMNGRPQKQRRFCEFLFYIMVIDSVGNIRPCCQLDAPLIGKLDGSETLLEIWNSVHFLNLRLAHLDEKIPACRTCGVNSFIDTQNIDEDVDIIRRRLTGSLTQIGLWK